MSDLPDPTPPSPAPEPLPASPPVTSRYAPGTAADLARQRLRRMQWGATALLAAVGALLLLARALQPQQAAWAWVAAFAEAALVGGLADWFAVVALFRRPLGLPIWHTAIVPARKDDIARNLGDFVETHLLTPEALRKEAAEGDPAARLAELLQQPDSAHRLAGLLLQAAPLLLDGLDDRRIAAWLAESVQAELARLDLPPLSVRVLQRLAERGQHQRLLDAGAAALQRALADPERQGALADFLVQALQVDNALYRGMIRMAAPRLSQALGQQLEALRSDPAHPWRGRLDAWVAEGLQALPASPAWRSQWQDWQAETLARPGVQAWLHGLWPRLKTRLQGALTDPDGEVPAGLARLLGLLGQRLQADAALRDRINQALADGLAQLVQRHRGAAARFLEAQLARWSPAEMSERAELAIGRDLQFIRINGTLVGGLVGLLLHALGQL